MGINPRPCGDKDPEPGGNDGGKACVALVLGGGGGGGGVGHIRQMAATSTGMSYSVTNMSGFHQSIGFHLSFGGRAIAIVLSLQGTMMYGVFIKGAR